MEDPIGIAGTGTLFLDNPSIAPSRLLPGITAHTRGLAWLVLILLPIPAVHAAAKVTINTERLGMAVQLDASARIRAPRGLVWTTLTDYADLWRFIPGLRYSRVIRRDGATAYVQEQGETRLLFLSFPISVVLASSEHPPYRIDVHAVSGDLKRLEGSYRITPNRDGTLLLTWSGAIQPGFWLPAYIDEAMVRSRIGAQFEGMVREIERRVARTR